MVVRKDDEGRYRLDKVVYVDGGVRVDNGDSPLGGRASSMGARMLATKAPLICATLPPAPREWQKGGY